MAKLDIILLSGLLIAVVYGYFMGLISMVASLLSFLIGIWVAAKFGGPVKLFFVETAGFSNHTATLATVILFLIPVGFCMHWSGRQAEKILKFLFLNWVNKASGMFIAFIVMLILESVSVKFASFFPIKNPWVTESMKAESKVYPVINAITPDFLPELNAWIQRDKKEQSSSD